MESNPLSSKNLILNYGFVLAISHIFLHLLEYSFGQHLDGDPIYGILKVVLMITVLVIGIRKFKSINEGFLSFGEAVKTGVGISVFAALIQIVYGLIFINFIEPNFVEQLLQRQEEIMYDKGISEEQVENVIKIIKKVNNPFISSSLNLFGAAFLGLIISAITGAIIKNKREK